MSDELVERLLDWPYQGETMAHDAAARIEALTAQLAEDADRIYALTADRENRLADLRIIKAERDRLREALTDVLAAWDDHNKHGDPMLGWWVHDAHAALKGETP